MKHTRKPYVEMVTLRNVSIPIFERTDIKNGVTYRAFIFSFTDQGQRKQRRNTTIEAAKAEALKVIRDQTDHQPHNREISLSEFAEWSSAMRILRQMPGIALPEAVAGFVRASAMLPPGKTLDDAARLLAASAEAASRISSATVADVVADFVASREKKGASDRYLRDCRTRLEKFQKSFRCPISSVTAGDLARWLDGMPIGNRSRSNYRNAVVTLFGFAKSRGHLPREARTEAELVERPRPSLSPIGIYAPADLRKMLDAMPPALLPAVAIQAFGGVRTAEVFRLEWEDVDLKRGHITVAAEKSKTASRRLVPILPALSAWLARVPLKKRAGRILSFSHPTAFNRSMARALKRAEVARVDNGLRHSFASYRLAVLKSADAVALEMGNSPRKLFQNYRELVTEADAAAWFSVRPGLRGKKVLAGPKENSTFHPAPTRGNALAVVT